jgi:hypothetical protein
LKPQKDFSLYFVPFGFSFIFYFFADHLNANDKNILCSNSQTFINNNNSTPNSNNINSNIDSNTIAYNASEQMHLIQITTTSSSSLQITDLNDSAIQKLSKRAKNRSKYAKSNRNRKQKKRRR